MRTGQIKKNPIDFVAEQGGSYAFVLGIDLNGLKPIEIYKWFLAALLYGARISEKIATHTWQVFQKHHVMSPRQVINTGWGGLVALLDEGGYARYDFKTATKLLTVNQTLLSNYDGDLNQLHAAANDACDLEQRIMALGKGIGKVTTQIFLREMRGRWCYAKPALSPLAWRAATEIGYLIKNVKNDARALEQLQIIWSDANQTAAKFPDFEAALVRYGLYLRHQDKSDHPNP
ncbi:hypothetical protein [Nitrosomonas aestuarii]|uniref:hypothetical protein n=1 Tax=Nitrosomonas aestuarii TaxID=52441 RepID=UPI000D3014CE|nr:hypothetical protein [Nitrosomonas aestuarii]PTN10986.1 hypothetical protein C8R11_11544 [Nitrosomonas aestuarii]